MPLVGLPLRLSANENKMVISRASLLTLFAIATTGAALASPPPAASGFDTLIVNARIVDGTGNPWYRGDIGIRNGRIAAIGELGDSKAARTIDAADRVVAPGFVDLMGQSSAAYVQDRVTALSRLHQGITTHVSGEGWSHAPRGEKSEPLKLHNGQTVHWRTYAEYFRVLEREGLPINVAHNVGAGQVREVVIGEEDRAPTPAELVEMECLVDQAMREGAFGLSTALIYPPGIYASTDELVALARVAARHGGIYSTHMRNESHELLEAIEESLQIGARAGIPVHIYHLKAAGRENWPLMQKAVDRIEAARRSGQQVTADIYPYIRNGLALSALIPPHHFARGIDQFLPKLSDPAVRKSVRAEMESPAQGWENWYRHVGSDWDKLLITGAGNWTKPKAIAGKSIAAAARDAGRDAWEMFFDLVQAGEVGVAPQSMDESQKRLALQQPWVLVETDTQPINPATADSTHPRAFGAFPRVLAKYVREEKLLTLEDAIRRMTSLPALVAGLRDRGLIAHGMAADLVVFDPQRIGDRATFEQPMQYAEGVDYLLINGELAIDANRPTGSLPGRVLRHLRDESALQAAVQATCR